MTESGGDGKEHVAGFALDMIIAERVMGWTRGTRWGNGNGQWTVNGKVGRSWDLTPRFSTDMVAAMQVENKIVELGLKGAYSEALLDIVAASIPDRLTDLFDYVHATAEQRCRAALAAIKATNQVREAATTVMTG